VWRVIQAEERKFSSRYSFKDKLGRKLIVWWSFKEDCNGLEPCQSVAVRRKDAFVQDRR